MLSCTHMPVYENRRFDLIAFTYYTWTNYYFTHQGQTSDAPAKSSTVPQDLTPPYFVQIFANVYFVVVSFLGSLNDLHINASSLLRGYCEDIAIYIDNYGKCETIPFGIIQRIIRAQRAIYILE